MIQYFKDMAFEVHSTKASKGTIVFVDGLPSNPATKATTIIEWNRRSYDVVYPRYVGTRESKSQFLKSRPQDDLKDFISALAQGLQTSAGVYKIQSVFILGSSFGGAVALSLPDSEYIKAVCALSQVVSFKNTPQINTLSEYLEKEHSQDYRFDKADFQSLLDDQIVSPEQNYQLNPAKVLIIGGKQDEQISAASLEDFTKKHMISLYIDPEFGHISLSKLVTSHYDMIDSFFRGFGSILTSAIEKV